MKTKNSSLKSFSHQHLWQLLHAENKIWDLIVVGGGITGAGIFRLAAQAGYKVLLIEQQDFAWGTSSRSSKMVHGGFRYIAQGDLQLTREALHEREQMLKEVPGLVDRKMFVFPLRKGRFPGRFSLTMLLKIYDFLAGVRDCDYIRNDKLSVLVQGIDKQNTKGAISYSDAITDDSRLVMRVIQEGKDFGGVAINYCKATHILRETDAGKVNALEIKNQETGEQLTLETRLVVNATGAWADKLMNSAQKKVRPLRGSHLVLKEEKFPLTTALTLIHPDDGRPIFMFPWYGRILLGTTDLDYPEDMDIEAAITNKEIDYLLKVVNEFFPDSACSREDIIATFCGVRPVISSGKGIAPSKEKRGHSVWKDKGLISVSGGKLTIFRVIADEVMHEVSKQVARDSVHKQHKSSVNIFSEVDAITDFSKFDFNESYKMLLTGRYGKYINQFLNAFEVKDYQEIANYGFSLADCRWAIEHEQVVHLDDLLLRRTRLGLLDDCNNLLETLTDFMLQKHGWSQERRRLELERYQKIKTAYYRLPDANQK